MPTPLPTPYAKLLRMANGRSAFAGALKPQILSALASALFTTISLFVGLWDQDMSLKIVSGSLGVLGILLTLVYVTPFRIGICSIEQY